MRSVMIPPREFLAKYLKRDYPDLNRVRVAVVGRDAPWNPEQFLYKHPDQPTPFAAALYALLGVDNFDAFKQTFVLTDALRCHIQHDRVPEKALTYCARHLREELKQFPNLRSIVILGEDAYHQFQKEILGRKPGEIKPFEELLKAEGWAEENVPCPALEAKALHVVYSYHPMMGYSRSPSLASALAKSA